MNIFDYMEVKKESLPVEETKPKLIFDYMNAIYTKDTSLSYDKKIAPAYMLSLWFSHDTYLLTMVDKINKIQWMIPDHIVYKYYMYKIPKGKRFIKYTKKVKSKLQSKLDILEMQYGISEKECLYYAKLL
jgi:hypothetical protein